MRARTHRAKLRAATRLGTLAVVSAALLIVGQFVALAGTDPTLATGSDEGIAASPSPTTTPLPPATPTATTDGTAIPDDETDPVTGISEDGASAPARSEGGAEDHPSTGGSTDGSGPDHIDPPPSASLHRVELDVDSHCDFGTHTGHVIIHATITNAGDESVDVTATDVTFTGDSDGPVTVAAGASHTFVFDAGPGPLPGGTVRFDLVWANGDAETVAGRHSPTNACGSTPSGPDLSLKKTGPNTVANGTAFSYTVIVTNSGAGAASDVTITDDLDDALTSVSASTSIGTCSVATGTNVVTCDVGTLGAAGSSTTSATITITATAPTGSCPVITNVATGTHAGGSIPASGTVSTSVTGCGPAPEQPGLTVKKTADAATVDDGEAIGFTIVVTSDGAATATDVTLEDPLPTFNGSGWMLVSGSPGGCTIANSVLSCSFGDLPSGATRTVHVTSPTTAESCGLLSNTATVEASNVSPATSSATVNVTCDQGAAPAISVVKTARPTHGEPGDTITYTYVVRNTGDATLIDVTVDDNKLGHICDIARLEPGDRRSCTATWTIPREASGDVRNVVVAEGTDESGETVRDRDTEVINVVLGRTVTPTPGPNNAPTTTPPSGLAFTGSGTAPVLAAAAVLLLTFGTALLWVGRRREDTGTPD